MLPADIFPTKKENTPQCTLRLNNGGISRNYVSEREETNKKKPSLSFMIEDILNDSRCKKEKALATEEPPSSPCNKCFSSPVDNEVDLSAKMHSEEHFYSYSQRPSRLVPSTTSAFLPPHSPPLVHARYGYYSPAVASSPPFVNSSRSPNVFTFHPCDFNENISTAYLRQDSCIPSSWCNPSAILDLTNYGQKFSSARILPSSVIALQNTNVECPGSRQIIWKHISRSSAKRKGGQIRFTNEQTTTLENTFAEHKYLSSSERKRLATVLRLSERQVKTWFQNRRAKWRRVKKDPSSHVSSSESEDCNATNDS